MVWNDGEGGDGGCLSKAFCDGLGLLTGTHYLFADRQETRLQFTAGIALDDDADNALLFAVSSYLIVSDQLVEARCVGCSGENMGFEETWGVHLTLSGEFGATRDHDLPPQVPHDPI